MTVSIRERLIAAVCTAMGAQYSQTHIDEQTTLPVNVVIDGADTAAPCPSQWAELKPLHPAMSTTPQRSARRPMQHWRS